MSEAVVIVGSGLAGYNLARELRKADPQVPIVLISRDHAGFYSKPMLSNALAGNKTAASLVTKTAQTMAQEVALTIKANTSVLAIDAPQRRLLLSDGEHLPYRDLVLALGADPIALPLPGDGSAGVQSVNDLDDYAAFAQSLEPQAGKRVGHVAILGAGLIGCEFANDLLHRQIQVTVLDVATRVLPRLLPEQASARLQQQLQAAGVQFRLGVGATAVQRDPQTHGLTLSLSDGQTLAADVVLSAVGLRPRTQLAQAAGLHIERGIVVDRLLATSQAHIYALGDCAELQGLVLPYILPLMAQARALAATLAGRPTAVNYPAMPVVVKTPACPTVICAPADPAQGQWHVVEDDEGLVARFTLGNDPQGPLLGFVLQGKAVTQRQSLAAQVPALLPALPAAA